MINKTINLDYQFNRFGKPIPPKYDISLQIPTSVLYTINYCIVVFKYKDDLKNEKTTYITFYTKKKHLKFIQSFIMNRYVIKFSIIIFRITSKHENYNPN